MSLKASIQEDMKTAMRGQEKSRLAVIRLILSAIKQYEVDKRQVPEDTDIIVILDQMLKQRRESFHQYTQAGRQDLAEQEQYEMSIIQDYLPRALTDEEINQMILDAIAEAGAENLQGMGKVMAILKPKIIGCADMTIVSARIKQRLMGA